ncbi:MAG: serine/threonine-protein kinase [Candidatus Eisenbacteria bacterium]|nr:serine/threonine-protein kinase [Candidatus Eisenbacteria bacterium]
MALAPGEKVGPFEVTGPLGAGGMGEVWRARDARLGRDVAIKVLPAAVAGDPERRARFERECRLLASLNHPHIAAVLGLEDAGGAPALVMELVEGPTLAERLEQDGALSLPEALGFARQIAEAVEYAHERGIVHRDLKPGNVKLTPEGAVKVLDFGLAKALAPEEASSSSPQLTQSPTMSVGTQAGVLLGTAAYMAPEQARGRSVDRRADIWAFGVMLFEMLTGRQLFAGETVSDTIARILERAPDWGGLPARTPARVRELLRRCLEKDAKQRLRDMGDARLELEAAIAALASGRTEAPAGATSAVRARSAALLVGLALVTLAGGWWLHARWDSNHEASLRLSAVPPDDLVVTTMMLARDRDQVVLFASGTPRGAASSSASAVYRRALDSFEWTRVAGSEGKVSWDLSDDGRWLYAVRPVAEGARELELQRIATDGSSPPTKVMPWGPDWLGWELLPDGRIVVVEQGFKRFAVVTPVAKGAPSWRPLSFEHTIGRLTLEETNPDGRTVLITVGYYDSTGWVVSAGTLDLEGGRLSIFEPNAGSPRLMPGNRMLMSRNGTLLAAEWDPAHRRLASPPVAVMQGLRAGMSWDHSQLRVSPRGDLGIVLGGAAAQQRSLAIVHRDGRVESWNEERRLFEGAPSVSADGRFAAVVSLPPGESEFEVLVLERGRPGARRFAFAEGEDCRDAHFSPDGATVVWTLQGGDSTGGLYRQPLDGSAPARRFLPARSLESSDQVECWFPDGRSVLVRSYDGRHGWLRRASFVGDSVVLADVIREPFNTWSGVISPDGRRIAYLSDEGGQPEVFVALLQPGGRAGAAVPVSRDYGVRPQWIEGGNALLWATRSSVIMTARVSPALDVSVPEKRLDLSPWVADREDFTALPGGDLLVTRKGDGEGEIRRFDIVLNYGPELERQMLRAREGR